MLQLFHAYTDLTFSVQEKELNHCLQCCNSSNDTNSMDLDTFILCLLSNHSVKTNN